MNTLHFSTAIKAPVQKVWDTMLGDKTYRQWTAAFHEGSYFDGSWEKGSKILFLGPDESGKLSGMVSKIVENKPYEFISIEHLGEVVDGVEDTTSDRVKAWAGSHENYTFHDNNGTTILDVDMEFDDNDKEMAKMVEMFNDMWPKALQKLKELAEA